MRLKDKVIVLAGSGFPMRELAGCLAAEGARAVLLGPAEAAPVPAGVCHIEGDPAASEDLSRLAETVCRQYGRIDGLLCGLRLPEGDAAAAELADSRFAAAVDGLSRQFLLCRSLLPHLRRTGGSLVFLSTSAGLRAPSAAAAECALSSGVLGLMRTIAADYAPEGLRANAICAGPGACSLQPLDRSCAARDLACCAIYLLSEESACITGAVLPVDGGLHML